MGFFYKPTETSRTVGRIFSIWRHCRRRYKINLIVITLVILVLLWIPYITQILTDEDVEQAFRTKFAWLHSRSLADFVRPSLNTSVLQPSAESLYTLKEIPLLIVVVISSPDNFEARQILRRTWARPSKEVGIFFLCGVHRSSDVNNELEREAGRFDDIIQEDFVDDYLNLTVKSVFMLKLLSEHARNSQFSLKVDDDMYVDLPAVVDRLRRCNLRNSVCRPSVPFCGGYLYNPVLPDRKVTSKWFLPPQLYAQDWLPRFVSGTAYLLSSAAVRPLYDQALRTPYINLEDVFLTGLVAARAGVRTLSVPGFQKTRPAWQHPCLMRGHLTIHGLSPSAIETVYEAKSRHCNSLFWSLVRALMIWQT